MGELLEQLNDSFAGGSGKDDEATSERAVREFYRRTAPRPQVNRIVADESVRDSERLDYLYGNYTGQFWAGMSSSWRGCFRPVPGSGVKRTSTSWQCLRTLLRAKAGAPSGRSTTTPK
jgi:hypothetical protein